MRNPVRHSERTPRAGAIARAAGQEDASKTSKKAFTAGAWEEARGIIWTHRKRLALGLGLMLINRLSGFVLPTTTKYLMDDVITQGHWELLPTLALAAGAATVVDAATSFANSQVLGVAAQRAITEMRKDVEAHVMRLPIRYFDSTKTGVLISRIMNDAEGIRNLVGTGLVQLTGSILTAVIALGVLLYLNWKLTLVTIAILGAFGGGMATAFKRLRPLFRERGKINAEVTGRLAESLGGVRIVKAYTAEKREELVFAKGAHRLFRNVAQSLTGVSAITAFSSVVIGATGVAMMLDRRQLDPQRRDDDRRSGDVPVVHRADDDAGDPAGVDRHADERGVRRARPHPRDPPDGDRRSGGRRPRAARRTSAARWSSTT